ncbi:MAG: dipeptidase [Devosiaceae bacterium]
MNQFQIFDGHNDLLARLYLAGGVKAVKTFIAGRPNGHLDAQKAKAGGFAGGFFAIWVPNSQRGGQPAGKSNDPNEAMNTPRYDLPLPNEVPQSEALHAALIQIQTLQALNDQRALTICTSAAALADTMAEGKIAALMHMEGAEAIDPDFAVLDQLYEKGLRSLGPVWSRPTRYGHGVPFRFPGSPDIGPGLTDDGKRLIKRCNALKVLVDLSHLNEAGFWDVATLTDAPLVATHSNAHALCPHARNLTDKQLDAIAESGGVVGVNFAAAFLRDDGRMTSDTPLSAILAQLDYLMSRMGEDHVALGSDFDGAVVPADIGDVSGLPALTQAMQAHGYGSALIEKICTGNWLSVLRRTLGN